MDFCKKFNARTAKYKSGIELSVKVVAYSDRTCDFEVSSPVCPPSRARGYMPAGTWSSRDLAALE